MLVTISEFFGTSFPTYKVRKLRKFKFSILSLFLLFPTINTLFTILVLLVHTFPAVVRFLPISQLILQFYDSLILKADPERYLNLLKYITLKTSYIYNLLVNYNQFMEYGRCLILFYNIIKKFFFGSSKKG